MWNPNTNVSEDCLYVNVWVPDSVLRPSSSNVNNNNNNNKRRSAVLVWIYGGAYMSGTSTLDVYDGDILAASEQLVVVSFNYRVGALGFMCMGNADLPCNQGMWDQVLALKWVRDNVANFGGDPEMVGIYLVINA